MNGKTKHLTGASVSFTVGIEHAVIVIVIAVVIVIHDQILMWIIIQLAIRAVTLDFLYVTM